MGWLLGIPQPRLVSSTACGADTVETSRDAIHHVDMNVGLAYGRGSVNPLGINNSPARQPHSP